MKWGGIDDIDPANKLLYWVLMFVLGAYFDDPIDHWLKDILKSGGGLSGDPGWEIEHLLCSTGPTSFRVWADPDMSGIEPSEAIYSDETVYHAIRDSLKALAVAYPTKADEVQQIIQRYNLQV